MLDSYFDEKAGIIRSVVKGLHDADENVKFIGKMEDLVAEARRRTGRALHLVDARESSVQTESSSSPFTERSAAKKMPVDKVAVIMTSALLKMQSQRLYKDLPIRTFGDEKDAIAWLLEADSAAA